MVGMFLEIEEKAMEELEQFFRDYITNPQDSSLERRGLNFEQSYCGVPVLSREVGMAGCAACKVALGEFSVEQAHEILKKLAIARKRLQEAKK